MKNKRGFTLIELLVVISIISLLVSILMPSLGAARRYAKEANCSVRLKGIGLGWRMYLDDSGGKIPVAPGIPIYETDLAMPKVLKAQVLEPDAWQCPADDQQYFDKYTTSYEYYLGLMLTTDPTLESAIEETIKTEEYKWPIFGDAEPFHARPTNPTYRLAVYQDGHVDTLVEPEELSSMTTKTTTP